MDGLKKIFESKKAVALIAGLISQVLGMYVFRDKPEMAENLSFAIITLVGTYLGAQGMADAFVSEKYHDKKKK